MRIEEIQFENFRKYVNTSIKFKKDLDKDIHVVIAENGAGKTTFLNAITWCLYNQESKIKDKNRALPTLNTEVSNNSNKDIEKASVSITVSDGKNYKLIFKRSDIFKIHSKHGSYFENNGVREEFIEQEFAVTEIEGSQSNVYRDEEDCELYVSSFIPEAIKEFFFFDGEQLDNYFLISTAIKEQVFKLSHIYDLDEMSRKITIKLKELRNQGNPNSNSDIKLKEYNQKNARYESEKERYEKLKETYDKLVKEQNDLINSLGNVPSLKDTEKKRNQKIKEKNDLTDLLSDNKKSLNDIIIKEAPKILVRDAFIESLKIIEENKNDRYIYPIDDGILEDSIAEKSCKVCDRQIDETLLEILKEKKAKLYLITPEEKILNSNKKYFKKFSEISEKYLKDEFKIQQDIKTIDNTIDSIEKDIKELYETMELHNHLKESIDRRDELINILPDKKSELDSIKNNYESLKNDADKIHNEYLKLLSDEEEFKDISAKISLCQDSLKIITAVKKDMMKNTRKKIQDTTNEKFFNLIRKNKSYGSIEINENYQVNLYDEDNRHALATASASEVELLALAFILAIHSVSGFESPLVVDTLLARTSGQQRLNVSQSCLNVSEEKQLLLFLINEEYSLPIQKLFKENHVLEYKLKESDSEKQITIEEL